MPAHIPFGSLEPVYFGGPFVPSGVIGFGGRPHEYELVFDEIGDEYSDICLLRELDDDEFQARIEMWAFVVRFRRAYEAGETPYRTPNVLAEDEARYTELKAIATTVKARGTRNPRTPRGARARFEQEAPGDTFSARWQVRWSPMGNAHIGGQPGTG